VALVGKPLPARALQPLAGGAPVSLRAEVRGPTIVNTFSSTCVPCIEESPALMALKAEGARIVGVAYKDDPDATRAFLDRVGDPFAEVLVDRDGRAGVDLGVSGVPETFLVGANGVVLAKYVGALSAKDAETLLEQAHVGGAESRIQ
jgi:cytochrome c biogenesis protein CcmG/thiol:disulfide interchange protein DsbE